MNKSIKYTILLGVIGLIGLSSCVKEEKDIFDQSSAQRLNEALKNYNEVLCSSTDGWAMEYFPNEQEQGYTFLMRFDKNTAVDMASKNKWTENQMLEESSLFKMIADNGPVLTFDTYNHVIHFFANPEDIGETEDDEAGKGFDGDYEFVVMKAEKDLVTLKGKKRNLEILLRRLPQGQVWSEYFKKLEEVDKSLFNSKIPTLEFKGGDEKYIITNSVNHVMHFLPEGGDALTQTIKMPFIVLNDGIRFVKPFKGSNEKFSISEFKIDQDGSLVSTSETKARIAAPELTELIKTQGFTWQFDKTQLGGKFATAYENVVADSKKVFNKVFQYFEFKVDAKTSRNALAFRNGTSNGLIYIDITPAADKSARIAISSALEGDNNGKIHLEKSAAYREFVELLISTEYEITSASPICPSTIKLSSINNPSDYIIVDVK